MKLDVTHRIEGLDVLADAIRYSADMHVRAAEIRMGLWPKKPDPVPAPEPPKHFAEFMAWLTKAGYLGAERENLIVKYRRYSAMDAATQAQLDEATELLQAHGAPLPQ